MPMCVEAMARVRKKREAAGQPVEGQQEARPGRQDLCKWQSLRGRVQGQQEARPGRLRVASLPAVSQLGEQLLLCLRPTSVVLITFIVS